MCRFHRKRDLRAGARSHVDRPARGFTLAELLMAMMMTSMMSVVLGGLVLSVQTAWAHTTAMEDATMQARVAVDRIRYSISHAGLYQLAGQPTRVGLAVVSHQRSGDLFPDVLVVWSGGREGGMAAAGVQTSLPRVSELIIYAPVTDDPRQLVEIAIPGDMSEIDFDDINFTTTILTLIDAPGAEHILLSERIHASLMGGSGSTASDHWPNIRFAIDSMPSDDALASVTPGTLAWTMLPWSTGIAFSDSGMRQATIRMELQMALRRREFVSGAVSPATCPFFGSASYRYAYRP